MVVNALHVSLLWGTVNWWHTCSDCLEYLVGGGGGGG